MEREITSHDHVMSSVMNRKPQSDPETNLAYDACFDARGSAKPFREQTDCFQENINFEDVFMTSTFMYVRKP